MKTKVTLLNMISGFILQFFTVISGLIVPRIILAYFGSEVNGLVTSILQFLSYISLVEGGVTSVVMANLYKPVVNNDIERINSVLSTAKSFFRKIGLIYILYSFVLAVVYPIVKHTSFSFKYVSILVIILSIGSVIQYMLSLTLRVLLDANKRSYIVSFTHCGIIVLNIFLVLLSVKVFPSIHIVKLISGLLFIIQPLIFKLYISRHYNINTKAPTDNNLIKERWNGFAINLAAFIHGSTDVVILTLFCSDLSIVSVYNVYALVTSGLKSLINSTTSGIVHVVGQAYAKGDNEELNSKLNLYEYIIFILVFLAYTLSSLLITPFVLLYTHGVTDANYNQPLFGVLLSIAEAIYLLKAPHLSLAYTANKFKDVSVPAYIEAAINITISLILLNKFGLVGVAVGTICAMSYRMVFQVHFSSKIIKDRKEFSFYKKLFLFVLTTVIGVVICINIPISISNVTSWIMCAIVYAIVLVGLYFILSSLFFKNELNYLLRYLKRK